jgi:hypothetical protein
MAKAKRRLPPKVREYRELGQKLNQEICDRATVHLHSTQEGKVPEGTSAEAAAPPFPAIDGLTDVNLLLEFQMRWMDSITSRWTVYANHSGTVAGEPPSGREVTVSGMTIQSLEDGVVAQQVSYFDVPGLLRQLRRES